MTDNVEPESGSRQRLALNWLLGLILVALMVLIAVLVTRGDDEPPVAATSTTATTLASTTTTGASSTTSEATTTTAAETTTTSEPEETTTTGPTTTVGEQTAEDATQVANDWLAALAAGDADEAFALMAPASQADVGGRSGFDGMMSALAEGFAAWHDAENKIVWTNEVAASNEGTLYVVTFVGTVTQEGAVARRAAALPVFASAGQPALVQPFLRGDLIQWLSPEDVGVPAAFLAPPTFEVIVPGLPEVYFFVDDAEKIVGDTTDQGDGSARSTATPTGAFDVGEEHVVTVVYVDDGIQHAEAVLFMLSQF